MNLKFIVLFIFVTTALFSQVRKITEIEFYYKHSFEEYPVKISFEVQKENKVKVRKNVKNFDTAIKIEIDKYFVLCAKLVELSLHDLVTHFNEGGDGSMTIVEFGDGTNKISISSWGLNKTDTYYSSIKLLEVVQHLLELAEVKIEELN